MKDNLWWVFWKRKKEVFTPQNQQLRIQSTVKPDGIYTYNDVFILIHKQLNEKTK